MKLKKFYLIGGKLTDAETVITDETNSLVTIVWLYVEEKIANKN